MSKMRTKNLTLFSKIERSFLNGRDENLSKTGRRQRRQRWPLENLSLVDVDHEKLSLVNVNGRSFYTLTTRKPQSWGFYWSTSTVDVDHWLFHGRRQADVFIAPFQTALGNMQKEMQKPKGK